MLSTKPREYWNNKQETVNLPHNLRPSKATRDIIDRAWLQMSYIFSTGLISETRDSISSEIESYFKII